MNVVVGGKDLINHFMRVIDVREIMNVRIAYLLILEALTMFLFTDN